MSNNNEHEFYLEFGISTFESDKDYKRFINSVKSIIRNSYEYKEWVKYVKTVLGYDYCSFTREISAEVTIDLHHHPISLENIVKIVLETRLQRFYQNNIAQESELITTFDIAKEVMKLHYEDKVGYVLLIKSLHEKFHNGALKIPIDFVHGNWKYILDNYYIPDDVLQTITNYASITLDDVKQLYGQNGYTWSKDNYIIGV